MMPIFLKIAACAGVLAISLPAQAPSTRLNPTVQQITGAISEERIAENLKKLEGFGTRYILSSDDDRAHGIGAARRWLYSQFESYSPRLEVSYQNFRIKKGARRGQVLREVQLSNVVAVLPGTIDKDRYVLITGHYDTVHLQRKPQFTEAERLADLVKRGMEENEAKRYMQLFPTEETLGEVDAERTAAEAAAPGVTDDGSGTAAVLETARVMSDFHFDKTVIFVAFAGEEIGLEGSKVYATSAKEKSMQIEAVLNNDIIGSDVSGNGRSSNSTLRMFAMGPEDSPSRALLRYAKHVAELYVPSMQVDPIFRGDRFNRGGDQLSFTTQGYAAVRLTTPSENFENQHSGTDTFANTSVPYTTRVTRMNAAVLASLALAPAPPVLNWTFLSGERKGDRLPLLTRGKSEYDAVMRWQPSPEPDIAGYAVMIRSTTAPDWEKEIWVGNVTKYTIANFSIDDVVIGVKAVDRDGNESMVSSYLEPVNLQLTAPPAAPGNATPAPSK
ncbi:MAG TPA: M28 family peptidase [Bryobacteraceae bacterium]|nr:M28 family peptidase [Bryobacteraceae bacterium]